MNSKKSAKRRVFGTLSFGVPKTWPVKTRVLTQNRAPRWLILRGAGTIGHLGYFGLSLGSRDQSKQNGAFIKLTLKYEQFVDDKMTSERDGKGEGERRGACRPLALFPRRPVSNALQRREFGFSGRTWCAVEGVACLVIGSSQNRRSPKAFAFRSFPPSPLLIRLPLAFAPLGNKRHHHHHHQIAAGRESASLSRSTVPDPHNPLLHLHIFRRHPICRGQAEDQARARVWGGLRASRARSTPASVPRILKGSTTRASRMRRFEAGSAPLKPAFRARLPSLVKSAFFRSIRPWPW